MKYNALASILLRTLSSTHLQELSGLVALAEKRAVDSYPRLPALPEELDVLRSFSREIKDALARKEAQ